jgi:hypothetical protein
MLCGLTFTWLYGFDVVAVIGDQSIGQARTNFTYLFMKFAELGVISFSCVLNWDMEVAAHQCNPHLDAVRMTCGFHLHLHDVSQI